MAESMHLTAVSDQTVARVIQKIYSITRSAREPQTLLARADEVMNKDRFAAARRDETVVIGTEPTSRRTGRMYAFRGRADMSPAPELSPFDPKR
jgi:hypothetical protein